jgi:signal transduction histidine kinase
MTLTNRLLCFFIGSLAVVLAGFSTGVYLLARSHLQKRVADRLDAAMRTLVAAAEVGPDGVEWEPAERALRFSPGEGVAWQVSDETGRVLDGSPKSGELVPGIGALTADVEPVERTDEHGRLWRITRERLRPHDLRAGGPISGRHAGLSIAAAVPVGPAAEALGDLATVLISLSIAVLAIAGAVGYLVCRRALAPVAKMASAARGMNAGDFTERLPVSPAADELADLGVSFNGLLDRLHESFERQRRFTGEASHQLRTPLSAILGQADVALRRDRPADEYRQSLAAIQHQASHLNRIVEALLFLARMESDAAAPSVERIDLAAWLVEHLRSWASHPRAADIRFTDAATGPAWVQAPPALLGELVNNLLDNALKYSESGTPVTIQIGREENGVVVAIEDQGCGIAANDVAGLFRPFFRTADARRRGIPGVGLGLAVAARLAKAFGGDIVVTSEMGRGSTFRLRLPAN